MFFVYIVGAYNLVLIQNSYPPPYRFRGVYIQDLHKGKSEIKGITNDLNHNSDIFAIGRYDCATTTVDLVVPVISRI